MTLGFAARFECPRPPSPLFCTVIACSTGEPSILQYSPSAVASLLVYIVNTISGVFFFCAMPWAIFALTTACMRRSVMW